MKTLIKFWMPILGIVVLFASCSKNEAPVVKEQFDWKSELNKLSQQDKQLMHDYFSADDYNYKAGADKMAAFVSSSGFGIFKNLEFDENWNIVSGELGSLIVDTDSKDFVRKNTDGTYSVSYKSSTATLTYDNFSTGAAYSGNDANGGINYTGDLIDLGFIQLLFFNPEYNAVSIHGTGKVSDSDEEYTMLFKWIINKNQSQVDFELK